MLLYTDGLVEGGAGRRHLVASGAHELRSWIAELANPSVLYGDALWALVERARRAGGGTLADDVALVGITVPPGTVPPEADSAGDVAGRRRLAPGRRRRPCARSHCAR